MSINVTVNGNPVNIRRGRMVLSDLDQIKKNERDRRRRLRLEQVRQQSKEISNRLHERAKCVVQKELSRLEKDGRSEIKQMHDRKILEMQRKYQEDMEDIGQAHLAATLQPDVDAIIESEKRRNRAVSLERGREAAQKLKDAKMKEQQERLKKVRELENNKAAAVAQSKVSSNKEKKLVSDYTQSDDTIAEIPQEKSPKKTIVTKSVSKKSPIKVITKSNVKVVANHSKAMSPHRKTKDHVTKNHPLPSGMQKKVKEKENKNVPDLKVNLNGSKTPYVTTSSKLSRLRTNPDSEIEEIDDESSPDINVNISSTKSSKPSRYNPEDYIHVSPNSSSGSDSSSSCSSSMSEDSSYFSDAADPVLKKNPKIPKRHATPAESKVQMYDHNTRQRNSYKRPPGIVERIDIRNEPNAEDLAREVLESESVNAELLRKRKTSAERRGQDALLRERVRRDYQTLLQNLDHLSREQRKLKASQVHESPNLHMSPMRRKDFQKKRQRKMNRAFEGILRNAEDPPYTLTEKIVTLKPQEDMDDMHLLPQASWQDPPFRDSIAPSSPEKKDSFDELSREEQILELLQKVERQKRILLREFGANLPSEVCTSSKKGDDLKHGSSELGSPSKPSTIQRPPSPEIQVINIHDKDHEEIPKQKIAEKKKVPKHTEIAVQTSTIENDSAEDKSVQVESDDIRQVPEVNEASGKLEHQNKENRRNYPLEPTVKVITPENVDSSSGSSIVTDLVISFDKKQVQVTPKRKKKRTLKVSRKTSPMVSIKSRSAPGSKASTPVKKSSRSAPPSRLPTPKKPKGAKFFEDRHDLNVNRGFRAEVDRFGAVTVDSSRESSQIYSTPDNGSAGKVYRIHTKSSKKTIRIRDASDTTSTSYASPPTAQAAALLNQGVLKDSTPILEMLDASAFDALHVRKSQISPVSTPETPSPRTMRLPSNVPNPEKISRMLRFNQMEEDSRRRRNDRNIDQERRNGQRSRSGEQISSQKSMHKCNCKNPNCKLHEDFDYIDSQALKNCPEIQKLYEELENVCAERIASLSDLIKKLRNEQKVLPPGVDFARMTPNGNTSFLQLSPGSLPHDLQDVRNLVENVEAINNQLARTLQESRRIIAGEGINVPRPPIAYSQIEKSPELSDSRSKESITSSVGEGLQIIGERAEKGKPKIISNEPVNLNIEKFRVLRSPSKMEGQNRTGSARSPSGHEDVVEQISKEILEQSKSLNKSSGLVTLDSLKETDSYLAMKNEFIFENPDSSKEKEKEEENVSPRRKSRSPEKKETDFVPLLAGIPKVSRTLPTLNPRGRPPVTLISGPYRPEITSPVHELSTIVEFDTPDTANRSQASVRSSPSKVKRNLSTDLNSSVSPSKKSAFKKPLELSLHKNSTISKPSVHVAPLPTQRTPHSTPKRSPTRRSPTRLFSHGSQIPRRKSFQKFDAFTKPKAKSDSTDSSELLNNKEELQFDTIHKDEKSTSNILQSDEPQRKLTSTSSNSFSALSGISEIASTPSSDFLKCASSPEEMERTLKKFGLGWAIATLKKTREASALSSSSNSDVTPINTARRIISPIKRQAEMHLYGLPDVSDVSSISIKEASKSTERAVLMKGRTSTPNILNSNSEKSGSTTASSSSISLRDPNDSLSVPNLFLTRGKKSRTKDTKPS